MSHFFSPSKNAFFAGAFRADYEAAGTWPSDAVEVTEAVFQEFAVAPPEGKVRGVKNGKPAWLPLLVEQTPEQVKVALTAAVQRHIDATAQSLGFDNIATAVSYADEPAVPLFQEQGRALRAWRSLTWLKCREVQAEVEAGTRSAPTAQQLIAELPQFIFPT